MDRRRWRAQPENLKHEMVEKCTDNSNYDGSPSVIFIHSKVISKYTGAMPIFKAYGDSSFQDCKRASEEAISTITKNLQGKVFSDSESIQARAEAVMLLKQLNFPVENLKLKLFEKLEQFLVNLHLQSTEITPACAELHKPDQHGSVPDPSFAATHECRDSCYFHLIARRELKQQKMVMVFWKQHKMQKLHLDQRWKLPMTTMILNH